MGFGQIDHLDCYIAVHHWVDNDEMKDYIPEAADQMVDGKNFLDDAIDLDVDPNHYDGIPAVLHNLDDDHIHDEEVVEHAHKEGSQVVVVVDFVDSHNL